ncbi:apoptosis-antagonizing transcription factor [Dipodascopsis uninucleata]
MIPSDMDDTALNGIAVKRQIAIYDKILDGRIQLQRSLMALNTLYQSCNSEKNVTIIDDDLVREAVNKIKGLLCHITDLRLKLLSITKSEAEEIAVSRKRSFDSIDDSYVLSKQISEAATPYRTAVLEKWSKKIQSSSGSGIIASKKFAVLNQDILSQITDSLQDMDRLLARTKVDRTNVTAGRSKTSSRVSDSSMNAKYIFDDTDFYQILLKDLVDQTATSSDPFNGVKWVVSKPKTKRADIDVKASKGRKLRYNVQEKIQNFMAPIPSESRWNDEQTDDLFSSLFGQKISMDEKEH